MAIRPDPANPAPNIAVGKGVATPNNISAFDAEAYYENYDHEAVGALSRKTLITPATYNRRGTVEMCVGATNQHKMEAKLYIHDDGSDEYDEVWLSQFSDRVFRHEHSLGGKQGVKDLRSNITKSVLGDFQPEVFEPWLTEDFGPNGPEYLYHVDSDGLHDPHFFYRLHEIMATYPNWGTICLYNAKFHARGKDRSAIEPHMEVRRMGAGISLFFRVQSFRDNPGKVQVPNKRGWDGFYSREVAKQNVATSLVSFVEHFGKWGFHNKGSFDRDRAINPTKYLASIREDTIERIEAKHAQKSPE